MYIVIYIHIYNHTYNYILYMYIMSFHFSHKQLSMPFLLPPNIISPVSLLPLMPIKLLSSSQGRQAGGGNTKHLALGKGNLQETMVFTIKIMGVPVTNPMIFFSNSNSYSITWPTHNPSTYQSKVYLLRFVTTCCHNIGRSLRSARCIVQ